MVYFGLVLISVAWIIQLMSKSNKVTQGFVLVYLVGVVFLVLDGITNGMYTMSLLNFVSFIVALLVFINLKR